MLHEPILNAGSYKKYFSQEAVKTILTHYKNTKDNIRTTHKVSENLRPTRNETTHDLKAGLRTKHGFLL